MEWLSQNWVQICGVLALGVQLARAIAKMTKSSKDDALIEKIANVLAYFIGAEKK